MRYVTFLLVLTVFPSLLSCTKEEGTPVASGVSITFRTDSGFTWMSDTVPQGDTLRIGVIITEGADDLQRFYLSIIFDGGAETGLDTAEVQVNPFTYETVHITRTQPGTEQVLFTVQEPDGDRTTRRLTFEVP